MRAFYLVTRQPNIERDAFRDLLLHRVGPKLAAMNGALTELRLNLVDDAPEDAPDAVVVATLASGASGGLVRTLRTVASAVDTYRVSPHIQRDQIRPLRAGSFPGVKLLHPITRRSGLSRAQFAQHWTRTHAPLALVRHPAMRTYIINVVERRSPVSAPRWDGFTEGYYASAEDVRNRFFDSPEGRELILADVARFIGNGTTYRLTEYVLR